MSQQKNGLIILSAFFVFLTLLFSVMWYITWSNNTRLQSELDQAKETKTSAEASVRELNDEKDTLRQIIGRPGDDVGRIGDESGSIAGDIAEKLRDPQLSDLTAGATNLETALTKTLNDRDMQAASASSRQIDLQNKIRDLRNDTAAKDAEINVHKNAREQAEKDKAAMEAQHSEELTRINRQFDQMRGNLNELQGEFDTFKTDARLDKELLEEDIREKRAALVAMRSRLLERDDLSFDRADGLVASVDHVRNLAYVNLGYRDELQVGATFSVYKASNSGVGRRNTEDIKASIEIVDVGHHLGPHLAEARITSQNRPIMIGDPVYSPVFTSGLKVEIAVTGMIDFDGSAGSDRKEFLRMVKSSGARVAVQTSDTGQFVDEDGNSVSDSEAEDRISERTRFLVIADLGESLDEKDSLDQNRKAIYRRIQQNTIRLRDAALEHGVYVVSLSSFLEFLGYSRKRIAWKPGQEFPGRLANGAYSNSVNTVLDINTALGNRVSTGTTSGKYSGRRRVKQSTGQTSKLYK